MFAFDLETTGHEEFYNITHQVQEAIKKSDKTDGVCLVFCPHTTTGITINENTDPNVMRDLFTGINKAFPENPHFKHAGGNSIAHLKSSIIGSSVTLVFENKKLVLGVWQGIYFCEFDGPRQRKFYVKLL